MTGEGFAFFRWHSLRYPESIGCDGRANDRNLCVAYWTGYFKVNDRCTHDQPRQRTEKKDA